MAYKVPYDGLDFTLLTVKSILEAISAPVGYCSRSTMGVLKP